MILRESSEALELELSLENSDDASFDQLNIIV